MLRREKSAVEDLVTLPCAYRLTVTARLLGAALDITEILHDAQAFRGPGRNESLAKADATLNKLRFYLASVDGASFIIYIPRLHRGLLGPWLFANPENALGGWIRQAGDGQTGMATVEAPRGG